MTKEKHWSEIRLRPEIHTHYSQHNTLDNKTNEAIHASRLNIPQLFFKLAYL